MSNLIDFRIRYQVGESSPHATLFKYLRSKDTEFSMRQMVVWALSAFWYPLACKWSGLFSENHLKAIARHAIYELQQQISYLARTFGLEQEIAAPGASYGLEASPDGIAPSSQPLPATSFNSYLGDDASVEVASGFDRHPDDDILDQNF